MKNYRDFYNRLMDKPYAVDELFQELGIDVRGDDLVEESRNALLALFAMKIKDLEQRVSDLEK